LLAAYSSLAPPKLVVGLAFNNSGAVTDVVPCTNYNSNSTCLPQIKAASGDSIKIAYVVNSTYTVNSTATVTLKGCFSPASSANRAWRKFNNVIAVSNRFS